MVFLTSELFLGHSDYEAVLLDFSKGGAPCVLVDDCIVTPRQALRCLFGISGQRAGDGPYRVLENIILDIEKRVSIAGQIAWQSGDASLICANNQFEVEYFPYFQELLARYRSAEKFAEGSILKKVLTRVQVGFW
jgi:hypothetical protein